MLIVPGPGEASTVGITLEPARGSAQPTGKPVLLLELPRA
jgi:hypothetical protein